ncbi:glycosyltransferase family 29 protein [Celeribacter marinus]|uniref:glycosyltransferase family 29 protein n=1 Tax=Celeribacter marinus TaxID=1397108 RepID=UPI003177EA89
MNRLKFYFARTLRSENPIARASVDQATLLDSLRGKTVAIVGNARDLARTGYGPEIEAHDVVIRINRAPMPAEISHGVKTDWLAMATRVSRRERARIGAKRLMWFSHKRKRLDWSVAISDGFYLHPRADYSRLEQALDRQPTTGAMLIDLIAKSPAAQIDLYGFDFFSSLSLSGRRTADDVPHDFDAEAQFVNGLCADDERITLHPMK